MIQSCPPTPVLAPNPFRFKLTLQIGRPGFFSGLNRTRERFSSSSQLRGYVDTSLSRSQKESSLPALLLVLEFAGARGRGPGQWEDKSSTGHLATPGAVSSPRWEMRPPFPAAPGLHTGAGVALGGRDGSRSWHVSKLAFSRFPNCIRSLSLTKGHST